MMIIGLVGFIGSGKGTCGEILEEMGIERESFAKPVKDVTSLIFNWDRQKLEGDTESSRKWREEEDAYWTEKLGYSISPRSALQLIGTECGRKVFHQDLWVQSLESRISERDIVITDVRFPNEIDWINKQGGCVIEIQRGSNPIWYDTAGLANQGSKKALKSMKSSGIHSSEWSWIGHETFATIHNDGTISTLKDLLVMVLTDKYGSDIMKYI